MSSLSRTKKHKTHNYKYQMEEPWALEALSASGEYVDGSASLESESHTHALAPGGVRRREDWHVEARRSLVDARVPPDG